MILSYTITKKDTNKTIGQIIDTEFRISNRLFSKLLKLKKINLNQQNIDTRIIPNEGDIISIDFDYEEENDNIVPTKLDLDIIYEDEWLLVVNKPAGIATHPSLLHYDNSLSNGVKSYFNKIGLKKKIRPVNRLDINTSGVIIFAKCEYIQENFSKQMQSGVFHKEYLCIVEGRFDCKSNTINLPIARKPDSIIERQVDENGQIAITHYEVLNEITYNANYTYSLLKCILETGRTHQIRVHTSAINHPIIGDSLYGSTSELIGRQALHSYCIKCVHPITKKELIFISEMPKDMKTLL